MPLRASLRLVVSLALLTNCASVAAREPGFWSVVVLGDTTDSRFTAVREAAEFWNGEFARLGIPIRFAPPVASRQRLAEPLLQDLSRTIVSGGRVRRPAELDQISGNLVVALSSSPTITSVGFSPARLGNRSLVILRPGHILPLSAPNVARNVTAHEIGHALGLAHNALPGTLMCMPPARCSPMSYRSNTVAFFQLTAEEQSYLIRRWR